VCRWAGVPLQDAEVAPRTREFAAMVESAGSLGPKNWRAQLLRQRTERWARRRIEALRGEGAAANDGTAAEIIASHRGPDGALLDAGIAAIELLNVLRPTVAVANFITFAALALHEHRPWGERFASGNDEDLRPFSQEVRRYYPFFPVVGGRARDRFEWHGHAFEKGQWVLLDLYGTNHDARLCHEPKSFRPERFRAWNDEPNTFIPQGAGHVETGHRCPGEEITVRLVEESVRFLTRDISYFVPPQRLGYRLSQLPALPQSGFQINRVAPR
jgi:fatty-acid peroxygenase